jgi:hypothetical protein
MNNEYETTLATESVLELSNDIIKAVLKTADTVGYNDPQLTSIIPAGIGMAIERLEEHCPLMMDVLRLMLEKKDA